MLKLHEQRRQCDAEPGRGWIEPRPPTVDLQQAEFGGSVCAPLLSCVIHHTMNRIISYQKRMVDVY